MAFDGTNYLIVYRSSLTSLAGVRVRASDGTILDSKGIELASTSYSGVEPEFAALASPRLIFDGTHFVMSWVDHPAVSQPPGDTNRLARIDPATGANLDRVSINLGFGGSASLAVGSGRVFAAVTGGSPWGTFLDAAKGAVDGPAFLLSHSSHWQEEGDSASDGQRHLVAWQEWNGKRFEIRGARVSNEDGTVLDADGISIASSADGDQLFPNIASNGSNYLVLWWDGSGLRANRVDARDGSVLDGKGLALPAKPDSPIYTWDRFRYQVASDGTEYLIVWIEANRTKGLRVRGSDGALLDAVPREIAAPAGDRRYARVTFSGSRYVALWQDGVPTGTGSLKYTLKAVRLNRDGSVLDPTPLMIGTGDVYLFNPRMAADGENLLITWLGSAPNGVKARRLRLADGAVLDAADLTFAPDDFGPPGSLVYDGANLVAMWVRPTKPAGYEAAVSWIGRTGALLDPSPTTLGPIDYPWRPLALSVGANGNLLATYSAYDDSPDFQTQRLRTRLLTGSPLGSDAAVPDGGAPAVDASGVLQEAGARDDAPVADGALDDALKAQSDAAPAYLDAAGEDGHNAGNTASAGTCACRLGGRSGPPALAILLVLVALPRRRRR